MDLGRLAAGERIDHAAGDPDLHHQAGRSLHALLDDTLTVSALDAEGVVARGVAERVDVAVRSALSDLPVALPEVDLRSLAPARAEVDRGHLDQVLTNLLTNAVKYGGGGFVISCREDADSVQGRITDHGAGVPPAFVPHLLDRLTRSEESRLGGQ